MTWENIVKSPYVGNADRWEKRHHRKIKKEFENIYKRINDVANGISGMRYSKDGQVVYDSGYLPSGVIYAEQMEAKFFEKLYDKLEELAQSKEMMAYRMQELFDSDNGEKKMSDFKYSNVVESLDNTVDRQKRMIIDFEKLIQALGE
tara:strand:- start:1563 stop:2003 length:441 start_codon:yes stop_codon:yes gene_type:complete